MLRQEKGQQKKKKNQRPSIPIFRWVFIFSAVCTFFFFSQLSLSLCPCRSVSLSVIFNLSLTTFFLPPSLSLSCGHMIKLVSHGVTAHCLPTFPHSSALFLFSLFVPEAEIDSYVVVKSSVRPVCVYVCVCYPELRP